MTRKLYTCPYCGEAKLHRIRSDMFWCDGCPGAHWADTVWDAEKNEPFPVKPHVVKQSEHVFKEDQDERAEEADV